MSAPQILARLAAAGISLEASGDQLLGLLPREIAEGNMVVLAYRHNGAQGLLTVPADRYDGLGVLEIFDLKGLGI